MKLRNIIFRLAMGATALFAALPCKATVNFTVLYSFANRADGGFPLAGLIQASDGNFYGTAWGGPVYRVTPDGKFTGFSGGSSSQGCLLQGSDGNFYGTTTYGGTNGVGTVFKLTLSGEFTTLHSFGLLADGGYPWSGLAEGPDEALYGTTHEGGIQNTGIIYRLSKQGELTRLVDLTPGTGGYPQGNVMFSYDGYFYGITTVQGGGKGTLFKLKTKDDFTVLHSFLDENFHGASPSVGGVIQARDGNFYGLAEGGGTFEDGKIYRVTSDESYSVIHDFNSETEGAQPTGKLVEASDGNFYGVTLYGHNGYGTVFRMTPEGAVTTIYEFKQHNTFPNGLIQGTDGLFYGTTYFGGAHGVGSVFKMRVPIAPKIQNVTQTNGRTRLTWNSVAGLRYQIQIAKGATRALWFNLGAPLVATNGITSLSVPISAQSEQAYRVVLLDEDKPFFSNLLFLPLSSSAGPDVFFLLNSFWNLFSSINQLYIPQR